MRGGIITQVQSVTSPLQCFPHIYLFVAGHHEINIVRPILILYMWSCASCSLTQDSEWHGVMYSVTVGCNVAFSPSVKQMEKDEHPVVSEGGCKQDFGCKVRVAAKMKRVGKRRK